MAKVRDLGIKVIPETMRPPEVGGGAAPADCNECTNPVTCIGCTLVTCGFVTPLPPCPCSLCSEPVTLTCRTTNGIVAATQSPEELGILRTQLREQLAILERAEIALREAELNAELERLRLHRDRLKAKK